MRSKFAVAAVALALVAAASLVIANPVGVPPTAKPFDVIEGKTISIDLGTPTAHGWYVLVWGSYKVGDQEFLANGAAKEGEFNPGAGCVYIAWEGGGQCFVPSENQGNRAHEFLKSIHGGPPITLGLIPAAGAHGAFYYRVDNAPISEDAASRARPLAAAALQIQFTESELTDLIVRIRRRR
jgi:hypothetical protein